MNVNVRNFSNWTLTGGSGGVSANATLPCTAVSVRPAGAPYPRDTDTQNLSQRKASSVAK